MDASTNALVTLGHGLGLIAMVSLAYGGVIRRTRPGHRRAVAIGLLFGLGAVLAMLDPITAAPGVFVDVRSVIIGLAAPFGGWLAAVIAAACAAAFRLHLSGAGTVAGLLGIAVVAGGGILFARLVAADDAGAIRLRHLSILGVLNAASILTLLALPGDAGLAALAGIGPATMAANLFGTVALGTLLSRERARILREARATEAARSDALTGLANRRAFGEEAHKVFLHAQRYGAVFSVLLVDCDRFKAINDTHGHADGDRVLVALASLLKDAARETDLVARYGGEEFVLLLPATGIDGALRFAERLRKATAEAVVAGAKQTIPVTVSIGVSTWRPGSVGIDDIVCAADAALYAAKRAGRNQVAYKTPDLPDWSQPAPVQAVAAE